MNHFQIAAIGVAVAAVAIGACVFRYDVVPVARGGDGSIAAGYRLDRWTGEVTLLLAATSTPVTERKPPP